MSEKETLQDWARSKRLLLTLLFTDIVASTMIGQSKGDDEWLQILSKHFSKGRELLSQYDAYVVKVIGDAFMVAFRNSSDAVDFAIKFSKDTGDDIIGSRVGINSGEVAIMDNDIYGLEVNKAARIQSMPDEEAIYISESVQTHYENVKGKDSKSLFSFVAARPKNFPKTRIWCVRTSELTRVYRVKKRNRRTEFERGTTKARLVAGQNASENSVTFRPPLINPKPPPLEKKSDYSEIFKNIIPKLPRQ